jgi:uncharacterized protein (DUF433 family)
MYHLEKKPLEEESYIEEGCQRCALTAQEKDALLERLNADPAILGGMVCVRGTRIPVTLILDALAAGETIEELLRGYPILSRDDVYAALAYGAKLAHERVLPLTRPS